MFRASEEDDKKRKSLIEMFQSLINIFQNKTSSEGQNFVEDFLSRDGTSQNIIEDCQRRINDLQSKEKVLIVAGTYSHPVGFENTSNRDIWFPKFA